MRVAGEKLVYLVRAGYRRHGGQHDGRQKEPVPHLPAQPEPFSAGLARVRRVAGGQAGRGRLLHRLLLRNHETELRGSAPVP